MPSYFIDEAPGDQFTEADWEEFLEDGALDQAGGGADLSFDDGEARLVGVIPANKKRSAHQFFCGMAWAGASGDYKLYRRNPVRHPDFPWMRCHSAHYLDFNPRATYKGGGVGYKAKVTGPDATEPLRYRLQFSRTKVTLTFKPVNYPLYPDSYMHSLGLREYYRNCEIFQSTEPILELLLAETTQYVKFLEGSDETSQPLIGEPFQGQTAERLEKISFWLAWYGVPFDYLTTPANPYNPVKITAGIGKVNENDGWLTGVSGAGHFRKGTLLMEAPRLRRRRQNARVVNDGIAFVYDVFFPFIYFDPEAGETNPRFRGWNLFPFARTGKFFSAARMGDVTKPVVPFYDFDRLFDHANKP